MKKWMLVLNVYTIYSSQIYDGKIENVKYKMANPLDDDRD